MVFLGFVISADGIGPDPAKLNKLRNFPVPTSARAVRAFLGLGSYYRRFIKDFGKVSAPLAELQKDDVAWRWTEVEANAFQAIRQCLTDIATQAHPDFTKPFILDCDASAVGIGFVLSQIDEKGRERIVMVDSRKFTRGEAKWHI